MTAPGPAAPPPNPLPPGTATPQGVPAPPAGPGAAPPFAAPPTEGRGVRLWLGLGAGAASLGLLGDWPHTRVLARRWVALLYTLPWLLGLGYLLDGAARLGASIPPSAGLHVLAVGAHRALPFASIMLRAPSYTTGSDAKSACRRPNGSAGTACCSPVASMDVWS